jgi:hypothetical protein
LGISLSNDSFSFKLSISSTTNTFLFPLYIKTLSCSLLSAISNSEAISSSNYFNFNEDSIADMRFEGVIPYYLFSSDIGDSIYSLERYDFKDTKSSPENLGD